MDPAMTGANTASSWAALPDISLGATSSRSKTPPRRRRKPPVGAKPSAAQQQAARLEIEREAWLSAHRSLREFGRMEEELAAKTVAASSATPAAASSKRRRSPRDVARLERDLFGSTPSLPLMSGRKGNRSQKGLSPRSSLKATADEFCLSGGTIPPTLVECKARPALDEEPGTLESLSTGEILLPSSALDNDNMRVANCGHRLSGGGPSHCASAPVLCPPSDAALIKELTPRLARGLVRQASATPLSLPARAVRTKSMTQTSIHTTLLPKRPQVPSHTIPHEDEALAKKRPPVGKDMMYRPENVALERSAQLMQALYKMRRAGQEMDSQEEEVKDANENSEDVALLRFTLIDLQDTSESLHKSAVMMRDQCRPVGDLGGTRHASTVVSMRTVQTIERKEQLLLSVEAKIQGIEAVQMTQEELFEGVSKGTRDAPPIMLGCLAFAKKHTHSDGEPVDADKSDFQRFTRTFGLPARHSALMRLEQIADAANSWWVVETLKRAEAGADADELRRLLAVANGIGAKNPNKTGAKQCQKILGDRLAEQALATAKAIKEKDDIAVSRSDVPQVDSARKCAEEINKNIKEAVSMGAPNSHDCLIEAKGIAVFLEHETKNRIAMKALQYAQVQKAQDENWQKQVGPDGIVEVGRATVLADNIEDKIKQSIKEGAVEGHEFLEQAMEISKALRDADGVRKRMAARAERQAKAG